MPRKKNLWERFWESQYSEVFSGLIWALIFSLLFSIFALFVVTFYKHATGDSTWGPFEDTDTGIFWRDPNDHSARMAFYWTFRITAPLFTWLVTIGIFIAEEFAQKKYKIVESFKSRILRVCSVGTSVVLSLLVSTGCWFLDHLGRPQHWCISPTDFQTPTREFDWNEVKEINFDSSSIHFTELKVGRTTTPGRVRRLGDWRTQEFSLLLTDTSGKKQKLHSKTHYSSGGSPPGFWPSVSSDTYEAWVRGIKKYAPHVTLIQTVRFSKDFSNDRHERFVLYPGLLASSEPNQSDDESETVAESVSEPTSQEATRPSAEPEQSTAPEDDPKPQFRTWHDNSGSYSVKAELISFDSGKVKLKTRDGSAIEVPVSRLSDTDRDFLHERFKSRGVKAP